MEVGCRAWVGKSHTCTASRTALCAASRGHNVHTMHTMHSSDVRRPTPAAAGRPLRGVLVLQVVRWSGHRCSGGQKTGGQVVRGLMVRWSGNWWSGGQVTGGQVIRSQVVRKLVVRLLLMQRHHPASVPASATAAAGQGCQGWATCLRWPTCSRWPCSRRP